MKITICGSSAFKEQMVDYKNKLQELGHEPVIHPDYEAFVRGEKQDIVERIATEHAAVKRQYGYIKWYHDAIAGSDAILVLNFDKKGIANYIGGNTLMEIGFAHVNGKKVFLLNPVPQEVSYKDEIEAMMDVILGGKLELIC